MYAHMQPTLQHAAPGLAPALMHPSNLENLAKQFHSQSNQVAAFASVQDLILAAIIYHGHRASLREIYNVCILHGHIAYSRSKGSRMITQNAHWKSQIRHALYTNPRFMRCPDDADMWTMAPSMVNVRPKTCIVTLDDCEDGWAIPAAATLPPPVRAPKPVVVDPMMAIAVPAHAKRKRSSCSRAPASCSSLDALSRQASAQAESSHVIVWQAYPNKHEEPVKYNGAEEEEDDSSSQSWQPSLAALRTPLTKGVVDVDADGAPLPIGSCTPPRPPPNRCQPARWSPLQQPAIVPQPAARNRRKNGRVQRSAMDGDVASVC